MDPIYTAEALSTGAGRNGRVTTSTGSIDFALATPTEMGGTGHGTNPEELFAAGYAACFHSALKLVARNEKRGIPSSTVSSRVHLFAKDDGTYTLGVDLDVAIPELELAEAQALADTAHTLCPYSNATSGNIAVTITVTTQALAAASLAATSN